MKLATWLRRTNTKAILESGEFEYRVTVKVPPYFAFGDWLFARASQFRLASTASSVIAVMPACMLAVPKPGSRNRWPVHCEGGIHYVWPFKFERKPAFVIVWAIAAHISRKQNKAAKQHY